MCHGVRQDEALLCTELQVPSRLQAFCTARAVCRCSKVEMPQTAMPDGAHRVTEVCVETIGELCYPGGNLVEVHRFLPAVSLDDKHFRGAEGSKGEVKTVLALPALRRSHNLSVDEQRSQSIARAAFQNRTHDV